MQLTQAILPVAGFGTRFLPWTKIVAKELLPIGNVPIIGLLVDECLSVGIKDICFVISKGKETIPQYFEKDEALEKELEGRGKLHMLEELTKYHEVRFTTVYQNEMKGDGHAILQAEDWVESDTVAILFGDDLIVGEQNGLQQLVAAYAIVNDPTAAMLCLQDVPRDKVSSYGIADVDDSENGAANIKRVKGLVEKPQPEDAPSTLGIVGKYIIPQSLITTMHDISEGSHGGEVRLIDGMIEQVERMPIYGCVFSGTRFDTGNPEGYKEAIQQLG